MRYLVLACRSLFKKGQHNVLKIVSLAVGLAVGLLLLAKVFFLRSYDTFYPGCENIYRVRMDYSVGEENGESFTTSGAVAPGMAAEIPGVETYARLVGYYPEYGTVMDLKGNRYSVEEVGMVDTTWFDLFKTPVLAGDPGKIFSNPLGAMVSRKMAERMGGISQVIGKQLYVEEYPMHRFTVEGVFEDLPENSSLSQEILISIHTPLLFQRLLSNWNGGERFQSFVRLSPGVDPSSLSPALDEMIDRHVGFENLEQEGLMMHYSLWPLTDYVMMHEQVRVMFRMLLLMAVVLLLVSVLNYGLISVSGILNRTREIAVRKCYGAGNKDILRLSLAETALHTSIARLDCALLRQYRGRDAGCAGHGFAFFPWRAVPAAGLRVVGFSVRFSSGAFHGESAGGERVQEPVFPAAFVENGAVGVPVRGFGFRALPFARGFPAVRGNGEQRPGLRLRQFGLSECQRGGYLFPDELGAGAGTLA